MVVVLKHKFELLVSLVIEQSLFKRDLFRLSTGDSVG